MRNPFAPPAATLEHHTPTAPRPEAVTFATRLLWLTLIGDTLTFAPGYRAEAYLEQHPDPFSGISLVVFLIVILMFVGGLVFLIGKRVNWARWLMFAITAFSWFDTFADFQSVLAQGKLFAVTQVAIMVCEMLAIKLLLFGEGARWFKKAS